jgi:putative effector of murein hydrolase
MSHPAIKVAEIWVYLSGNPLFALVLTLTAYQIGLWFYVKSNKSSLVNPVAIAVVLVASVLLATGTPYAQYFEGAQFVHFLLGTATVSLAVPIYRQIELLKTRLMPLLVALVCGGFVSIASAVGIAKWLAADSAIVGAMYAKSVTAPIAMGIALRLDVSPTLTAVFAIVTGIMGAVLGTHILNFIQANAWWQRGFAMGVAAHGIGTSRAFAVHPEAGAYASLAMGLHGILGALLIPLFKFEI